MAYGNLTDENIKSLCCQNQEFIIKTLCCFLWIFETRIAIDIMTNQHQHHDCEDNIMMFNIMETITQL